jgi:hypothetical protein
LARVQYGWLSRIGYVNDQRIKDGHIYLPGKRTVGAKGNMARADGSTEFHGAVNVAYRNIHPYIFFCHLYKN